MSRKRVSWWEITAWAITCFALALLMGTIGALSGCDGGLGINADVTHKGGQKVEIRHDHYIHLRDKERRNREGLRR